MPSLYSQATVADRVRKMHERRNEIGDLPPVINPERKAEAEKSLPLWLQTYFPTVFSRPFCEASTEYLISLNDAFENGGMMAVALPRGFGKTAMTAHSAIYALITGKRKFVVLVGATQSASKTLIADIKGALMSPMLKEDYPELVVPFEKLDGKSIRGGNQLYKGKHTDIKTTADTVILPKMGQVWDTACIVSRSITGAIRGTHIEVNGNWRRPDFVLLDDVEIRSKTNGKAGDNEYLKRERIIQSEVLGLAGHDTPISAALCCTVISDDDLSSNYLSDEKHPEWRGKKFGIITGFGSSKLWENYDAIWKQEQAGKVERGTASSEYITNVKPKLKGVEPTDHNLFSSDTVDAVEYARTLWLKSGERAFLAEYQNSPVSDQPEKPFDLCIEDIFRKTNNLSRCQIPDETIGVFAAVDINKYALGWSVASVSPIGNISVIDYGWFVPKGKKTVWTDKDNKDVAIATAIDALVAQLYGKSYGEEIDALTIDSAWATAVVQNATDELRKKYKGKKIFACKGVAADKWWPSTKRKTVLYRADGVELRKTLEGGWTMIFDSHMTHLMAQKGWLYPTTVEGMISIFGKASEAEKLRPYAEQIIADEITATRLINGRTYCQIECNSHNEMSDCLSMIMALARLHIPTAMHNTTRIERTKAKTDDKTEATVEPVKTVKPWERRKINRMRL